jgi:hypothetical protein
MNSAHILARAFQALPTDGWLTAEGALAVWLFVGALASMGCGVVIACAMHMGTGT